MSKWMITKNKNHSTGYDQMIERAEGVYDRLVDAMYKLDIFVLETLPDGSMWAYDENFEDMTEDISGAHSLASITRVVD